MAVARAGFGLRVVVSFSPSVSLPVRVVVVVAGGGGLVHLCFLQLSVHADGALPRWGDVVCPKRLRPPDRRRSSVHHRLCHRSTVVSTPSSHRL